MKVPANFYFKECGNNKTIFNQLTQLGLGIVSLIINFNIKWFLVLSFLMMFQENSIQFMARKLIASNYLWWKYLHQSNNEMLQIKAFYLLTFLYWVVKYSPTYYWVYPLPKHKIHVIVLEKWDIKKWNWSLKS